VYFDNVFFVSYLLAEMSAALLIVLFLLAGGVFVGGYYFLHYWLEIRPFQKKFRRDVEFGRSDENENLVASSVKPVVFVTSSGVPGSGPRVDGDDEEGHELVADVERRRARAARKLEDDDVEDISPPESVGDFRRGTSARSTGSRHSADSGSVGSGAGAAGDEPTGDRSSPSGLYPSIRE
jgi:hypothetical protein